MKHHYIILICAEFDYIKFSKKYKLLQFLEFNSDNLKDIDLIETTLKHNLFKTPKTELIKIFNSTYLYNDFYLMEKESFEKRKSLHYFSSDIKLDKAWFEYIVNNAYSKNINCKIEEWLKKSKI